MHCVQLLGVAKENLCVKCRSDYCVQRPSCVCRSREDAHSTPMVIQTKTELASAGTWSHQSCQSCPIMSGPKYTKDFWISIFSAIQIASFYAVSCMKLFSSRSIAIASYSLIHTPSITCYFARLALRLVDPLS